MSHGMVFFKDCKRDFYRMKAFLGEGDEKTKDVLQAILIRIAKFKLFLASFISARPLLARTVGCFSRE